MLVNRSRPGVSDISMLTILNEVPEGLLELEANQLSQKLGGPTLIHLPGVHPEPLFVSVLLHGNEVSGWLALRKLLREYWMHPLPRALSVFIGNVSAAADGRRHLDGQHDYNRVWADGNDDEHRMAQSILDEMQQRRVFASIDIHNNTGTNPHYACVNSLDDAFLNLALLFSRTVVYFTRPDTVQSMAFSEFCPSVTLECGRSGQAFGVEHCYEFLKSVLHLEHMPVRSLSARDIDLFHTVAIVKVASDISIGFGDEDAALRLIAEVDHLNFSELASGTLLGYVASEGVALDVRNDDGEDVGERYFNYQQGEIRTCVPLVPSMLTLDKKVVRQDCLCYLMERMNCLKE